MRTIGRPDHAGAATQPPAFCASSAITAENELAQEYTARQKAFLVDDEVLKFEVFMDKFLTENVSDLSFVDSALGLLVKIYQQHSQGRYLTKTQACRLIKSRNPSVCQKYVEEAERRGFIQIVKDEHDGRRMLVKPLPALLDFVDEYVVDIAEQERMRVAVTASIDPLPEDNKLMQGYKVEIVGPDDGLLSRKQEREMQIRNFTGSFLARFNPLKLLRT